MGILGFILATVLGISGPAAGRTPGPLARGNNTARELLGHSSGTLYRIDLSQGAPQVQRVGDFGAQITDIARTQDGRVFGVSFTALYLIDLQQGRAMQVGRLGADGINGLTATGQQRLLASSTNGSFYSVDTASGRATMIGRFGPGVVSSGDLCVGPGGVVYMTAPLGGRQGNVDQLVRVDPVSGQATPVGRTGLSRLYGLAHVGDELVGLTEGGQVATIDLQTGVASPLGQTAVSFWGGS